MRFVGGSEAANAPAVGIDQNSNNPDADNRTEPVESIRSRVNAEAQLRIATDEVDRLRRDLVDAKKKLEEATLAKSDFMANMSHELLTPMNGIVGMTDLLLSGDLPNKEKRFVQSIAGSSNTLMGIINDLLDFSKIESGGLKLEHARFSLHDCVEDVCSILASSAHAKKWYASLEWRKRVNRSINAMCKIPVWEYRLKCKRNCLVHFLRMKPLLHDRTAALVWA